MKGDSPGWRKTAYRIIFEADTRAGRWFDILLIVSILASVTVVMLDSVRSVRLFHGAALYRLEWFFTLIFTAEYLLRLLCAPRPLRYATSFFGTVDLLSILPTYLSIIFPASKFLVVIRLLRILRIFRVLKLVPYVGESEVLMRALWRSRRKITVFIFSVLVLVCLFGSMMYVIEGEENGFTSIPRSVYWAVVTMTTVGYGDISPKTNLGQLLAAIVMILGFAIIAVPTGIVTAEMAQGHLPRGGHVCPSCGEVRHDGDARYCRRCASPLAPDDGPGRGEGRKKEKEGP